MLRRIVFVFALAAAATAPVVLAQPTLAPATSPASAASVQTPNQVVQSIADQLSTALDGHRADFKNNKTKLIDTINQIFLPHFDRDYAAILVLGRHARQATPAQRERFAKAFYNSITHKYAEGLLSYTRGAVKVLPFRGQLDDRRTIVRTQVKLDNGKTLSIDYAFRKNRDGSWKVYDVIIEGISYIANYRNQVDAEIRKEGLDALIKNLETQGGHALDQMQKDGGGAKS